MAIGIMEKYPGVGSFIYDNGDTYEGNFSKGKINGQGKMQYKSGDVYAGEWEDGIRIGNWYSYFEKW